MEEIYLIIINWDWRCSSIQFHFGFYILLNWKPLVIFFSADHLPIGVASQNFFGGWRVWLTPWHLRLCLTMFLFSCQLINFCLNFTIFKPIGTHVRRATLFATPLHRLDLVSSPMFYLQHWNIPRLGLFAQLCRKIWKKMWFTMQTKLWTNLAWHRMKLLCTSKGVLIAAILTHIDMETININVLLSTKQCLMMRSLINVPIEVATTTSMISIVTCASLWRAWKLVFIGTSDAINCCWWVNSRQACVLQC